MDERQHSLARFVPGLVEDRVLRVPPIDPRVFPHQRAQPVCGPQATALELRRPPRGPLEVPCRTSSLARHRRTEEHCRGKRGDRTDESDPGVAGEILRRLE